MRLPSLFFLILLVLTSCQEKDPWAQDSSLPSQISFNQHIRPLLARECIQCHGPTDAQANLRLDRPSGVSSVTSDNSPRKSLLWEKVLAGHPVTLPDREQALLWRWIKQGSPSEGHWASLPLSSPSPNELPRPQSLTEGIDQEEFAFLARTLLGRKPFPEELALLETSKPARGQVLDGLMASESFTKAFRARLLMLTGTAPVPQDTPFEPYFRWLENELASPEFSLRDFFKNSLAGDLPPQAGQQGTIATAWVRLPNRSGFDTLAERVAYSFLGLDLNRPSAPNDLWAGARDSLPPFLPEFPPATQGEIANPPFLAVQTPDQASALSEALIQESALWEQAAVQPENLTSEFKTWLAEDSPAVTIPDLAAAFSFEQNPPIDGASIPQAKVTPGANELVEGVQGQALAAPATFTNLPLSSAKAFTLSFFLKVPTLPEQETPILYSTTPGGAPIGFELSLSPQKLNIRLLNGSVANSLSVTSNTLPTPGYWHHFTISYDGSRSAAGFQLWIDCVASPLEITNGGLYGIAQASQGQLQFRYPQAPNTSPAALDELQVHQAVLSSLEIQNLRDGTALLTAVRDEFPREDLLIHYYLRSKSKAKRSALRAAIAASSKVGILQDSAFLVPVAEMTPLPEQRPTLPFFPLALNANADRLGLAQWLFNDRNPVTTRVIVSRLYQMVHGVSLLPSNLDLSDPWQVPPNQALLDFLARDLITNNWDLRAILQTIILYPPTQESPAS